MAQQHQHSQQKLKQLLLHIRAAEKAYDLEAQNNHSPLIKRGNANAKRYVDGKNF
jgi:hypothetical protein